MRSVPGFDALLRASLGRLQDAVGLPRFLDKAQDAATVEPQAALRWRGVQAVLDAPEPIPLFIAEGAGINGFTVGVRQPHVVLTQEAARLPAGQVRGILAHELGHVLSGHVLYKTLVRSIEIGRWWLLPGGLNLLLTAPVLLALYEWDRKSELSADRAQHLVVRDLAVSEALLRAAHRGVREEMEARYARVAQVLPAGAELLAAFDRAFAKHPPIEERVAALHSWDQSDQLRAILAGDYPRRSDQALQPQQVEDRVAALKEGLQAGVSQVGSATVQAGAQATAWLSEAGGNAAGQAGKALDWLSRKAGGD